MKIIIDGKEITISSEDKNIVDVADRAKIGIPAPCYRANKSKGCCYSCVVEINGKQKYACNTKPIDGMDIIFNREDLKELRKERILKYQEQLKNPSESCGCNCDCSESKSNCC